MNRLIFCLLLLLSTIDIFAFRTFFEHEKIDDIHYQGINLTQKPCKDSLPNIRPFHKADIIIGAEVFSLKVKEVRSGNEAAYLFQLLDASSQCTWFQMQKLEATAYNLRVFSTLLSSQFDSLNRILTTPIPVALKDSIALWSTRINTSNQGLTNSSNLRNDLQDSIRRVERKIFDDSPDLTDAELKNAIRKRQGFRKALKALDSPPDSLRLDEKAFIRSSFFSAHFQYKEAEQLLSNLQSASPRNKEFLDSLLMVLKVSEKTKIEIAKDEIDNVGKTFLTEAFIYIYKNDQKAPLVGKMSAMGKVPIYRTSQKPEPILRKGYSSEKECITELGIDSTKMEEIRKECYIMRHLAVDTLSVKEVELKFEAGQLSSVKVLAIDFANQDPPHIFHTRTPIGFSSKGAVSRDIVGMYKVKGKNRYTRLYSTNYDRFNSDFMRLKDVIFNNYKSNLYTENYSPRDTVITLIPESPARLLYQLPVTEILQAKVFTDFVGYDVDKPNGLVQVEFDKRFYLNAHAHQIGIRNYFNYHTSLNYIEPKIVLSKIEGDERFLNVTDSTNMEALDFLQHQNLNIGGQLNLLTLGIGEWSSIFRLDMGLDLHRSEIKLLDRQFNASGISFYPKVEWEIRPSTNYFVEFSYDWRFFGLMDESLRLRDENTFFSSGTTFHRLELLGAARINPSTLFFRARLQVSNRTFDEHFLQLQFGFAFSFFSRPRNIQAKNPLLN